MPPASSESSAVASGVAGSRPSALAQDTWFKPHAGSYRRRAPSGRRCRAKRLRHYAAKAKHFSAATGRDRFLPRPRIASPRRQSTRLRSGHGLRGKLHFLSRSRRDYAPEEQLEGKDLTVIAPARPWARVDGRLVPCAPSGAAPSACCGGGLRADRSGHAATGQDSGADHR